MSNPSRKEPNEWDALDRILSTIYRQGVEIGELRDGVARLREALAQEERKMVSSEKPYDFHADKICTRLRDENARLRVALEHQIWYWTQLPSGIDEEAREDDRPPADTVAHIAGLAVRAARAALLESADCSPYDCGEIAKAALSSSGAAQSKVRPGKETDEHATA